MGLTLLFASRDSRDLALCHKSSRLTEPGSHTRDLIEDLIYVVQFQDRKYEPIIFEREK